MSDDLAARLKAIMLQWTVDLTEWASRAGALQERLRLHEAGRAKFTAKEIAGFRAELDALLAEVPHPLADASEGEERPGALH